MGMDCTQRGGGGGLPDMDEESAVETISLGSLNDLPHGLQNC